MVTGVQFTNAFTPCPVCSPARASLLTGRIPSQHGVHDFLAEDPTFSAHPWLTNEILLSQLLQRQGYQTGLVGKWQHADIPVGERSHLVPGNPPLPEDQHERVAQYYAGVTMIDHQVGTLLDYLEGQGILDKMIVIYIPAPTSVRVNAGRNLASR